MYDPGRSMILYTDQVLENLNCVTYPDIFFPLEKEQFHSVMYRSP